SAWVTQFGRGWTKEQAHRDRVIAGDARAPEHHVPLNVPDQVTPRRKGRDALTGQENAGGGVQHVHCLRPPNVVPIQAVEREAMGFAIVEVEIEAEALRIIPAADRAQWALRLL